MCRFALPTCITPPTLAPLGLRAFALAVPPAYNALTPDISKSSLSAPLRSLDSSHLFKGASLVTQSEMHPSHHFQCLYSLVFFLNHSMYYELISYYLSQAYMFILSLTPPKNRNFCLFCSLLSFQCPKVLKYLLNK